MADLQELFARIKNQSTSDAQSQSPSSGQQTSPWAVPPQYQQSAVTSPMFSPPIQMPDQTHSSNIVSPVNTGTPTAGTPGLDPSRTNNLLNLLKFNTQSGQQPGPTGAMASLQSVASNRHTSMQVSSLQPRDISTSRPLSAADLMSTLQRKPSASRTSPMSTPGAEKAHSQSGNPQDFLLNLLRKPNAQPPQILPVTETEVPPSESGSKHGPNAETLSQHSASASIDSSQQVQPQRGSTPARQFDSPAGRSSPFQAPQPTKATMFSYVNPFDQLHSSSPLNRTPKPEQRAEIAQTAQPKKIEILKHNRDVSVSQNGDSAAPAAKSRKVETDDHVPTEAKAQQSVSEVLEGVGEQVDREVEKALAQADTKPAPKSAASGRGGDAANDSPAIKKETVDNDDIESSWESAEDTLKERSKVEVYNFPMKPFVSLQIKLSKPARPIRQEENFMVIAQLKKEFDQIDRCLATASQAHIVYAQVATKKDNGGFRIFRQDSGDHKQIFRSSGERIFNVQLCNSGAATQDIEAVLGTGVNGSVFWTSLAKSRGDLFADDDVEARGFIMPPVQTAEENTSGSPVKTRAKLSSRHSDFFAVARGKQIFIVAPDVAKSPIYCDPSNHKVNSEKYFEEHNFKINTGKAGKDFCFSEDDSVIVSLDKNGRFKFWDIRDLTSHATKGSEVKHEAVELRDPLWTLNAAASGSKPDEKPSVSSIMFLDKDRPFTKGTAFRYMLIGFKQNHILQLWDLGLGKAVQEIRLPHEKDSDGICSIGYHSKTGMVAVGHPTRNSVYFIHLSAPKYNLPTIEQARYVSILARGEAGLPKPESTAIMSGLREFSFAKVGQLRSVDMLRTPVPNASEPNSEDEPLFELYIMHSKGVVGVNIKREDLGWDTTSKMVNSKDALKEGLIEVSDLLQPHKLPGSSDQQSNAEITAKAPPKPSTPIKKPEALKQPALAKTENKKAQAPAPASNGAHALASSEPAKPSINPPFITSDSYALATQRPKSPVKEKNAGTGSVTKGVTPPKMVSSSAATTSSASVNDSTLSQQFESLYQRIEADKRVQDAAAVEKQVELLRLVSSTLTDNVDRSLANLITSRIEKDVIPTLTSVTSKIIDQKITESLPSQLNKTVTAALKASLSNTLVQTLKDKDVNRMISEQTANTVAAKVQQQVSILLQQSLPGMATQAAQKMIADVEKRLGQQIQLAEVQRQRDNAKIEELSKLVHSLSATIENMAAGQSAFQEQILQMQRESKSQAASNKSNASSLAVTDPQADAENAEVAEIAQMLINAEYEQATIKWISSDRQAEIFDKLFVQINPGYLQRVTPLVALTVSAAITSSFDTYVSERLDWLGRVLAEINMRDGDIRDVAPKIMDVLSQRLQAAYMVISEANPNDPVLRTVAVLNKQVTDIRRLAS